MVYRSSAAYGVSDNIQVGNGVGPSGQHALMWRSTPDSVVDLHPAGYVGSWANDVAGDVQVGSVWPNELTAADYTDYAYAWYGTAESGVNLHCYLEDLGPEFTFSAAFSVTDDGTIYGRTNGNIAIWTPIAKGDFDESR